jgi:hypothetical protein
MVSIAIRVEIIREKRSTETLQGDNTFLAKGYS